MQFKTVALYQEILDLYFSVIKVESKISIRPVFHLPTSPSTAWGTFQTRYKAHIAYLFSYPFMLRYPVTSETSESKRQFGWWCWCISLPLICCNYRSRRRSSRTSTRSIGRDSYYGLAMITGSLCPFTVDTPERPWRYYLFYNVWILPELGYRRGAKTLWMISLALSDGS